MYSLHTPEGLCVAEAASVECHPHADYVTVSLGGIKDFHLDLLFSARLPETLVIQGDTRRYWLEWVQDARLDTYMGSLSFTAQSYKVLDREVNFVNSIAESIHVESETPKPPCQSCGGKGWVPGALGVGIEWPCQACGGE